MTERVRDLGEFALIERLVGVLPERVRGTDLVAGAGDDCAWWPNPEGTTVVTSDAMVEGVHFRLDWTDWRSLGHKMIAVNLSDLASMGSSPRVVIVTLALTGEEDVADLEDLYRGAGELAAIYDVVIAGGDMVRTTGPLLLSVTAIGEIAPETRPMLRSAARPGDLVVVSGTLGASAAGMSLLQDGGSTAATAELLIGAHLRPAPRVSLGVKMHELGIRCCMDLSDGLAGDLPKILQASGVGARVNLDQIPILPAVRALFPDSFMDKALHGGEDYELLFAVPPARFDEAATSAARVGATLTAIGEYTEEPTLSWLDVNGSDVDIRATAWDHFRDTDEPDSRSAKLRNSI